MLTVELHPQHSHLEISTIERTMDSGVLTPGQTASPSPSKDAVPAPAARPSPTANLEIAEDTYKPCPCGLRDRGDGEPEPSAPKARCAWCDGSGYRLTKRILRPKDLGEQQATAVITGLRSHLARAAKTLDHAAALLDRSGSADEAQATRRAASALRESAQD